MLHYYSVIAFGSDFRIVHINFRIVYANECTLQDSTTFCTDGSAVVSATHITIASEAFWTMKRPPHGCYAVSYIVKRCLRETYPVRKSQLDFGTKILSNELQQKGRATLLSHIFLISKSL